MATAGSHSRLFIAVEHGARHVQDLLRPLRLAPSPEHIFAFQVRWLHLFPEV